MKNNRRGFAAKRTPGATGSPLRVSLSLHLPFFRALSLLARARVATRSKKLLKKSIITPILEYSRDAPSEAKPHTTPWLYSNSTVYNDLYNLTCQSANSGEAASP